ncbi:aminoglycoside phosphotransferase (APT) family kinase protein [Kribbella aluminosa]|uniref:Aminoglycoside phosphotransferase (APT) family kinase protein n=1 Tax=Kribbella aluminosa TaxID=416017 RepID=A0ABS4URJ8_9ACTN|nr:aminoglycoside phosphotransferase family protein [Kribbella aluminosa]MBP2354261.1 aminoglycoside phosphotransferase (APT) family kinase protein [Kribbella aluminosa]
MREDLLAWATATVGPILETHPLHDDQGPWRLTTRARPVVLRAPTPRIDPAMIATAALTRMHAIAMQPADHLPFRPRPIAVDDFATDRRTGRLPTTPLLEEAHNLVLAHGRPPEPPVFLHGDVWPGNLIWSANTVAALIDWKTAGVGPPGVDLSELRKQTAITFGPEAPTHALTGWEQSAGHRAPHVPYWDAVAALNTPTTLYSPTATTRRDTFLSQALAQLR